MTVHAREDLRSAADVARESGEWHADEALAYALAASGVGHWRLDLETGCMWISEGGKANLGLGPDASVISLAQLIECVHEDDRSAWLAAFDRAVAETGEYAIEHRLVWPSGETRWMLVRGRVLRSPGGRAFMAGISVDITGRRQVEEERERLLVELATERARLRAIIDHMPASMIMGEASSERVVLVNRRAESFIPVDALPVENEALFEALPAYHPDGRPLAKEDRPLSRALRGEHVESEDYRFTRADGTETWLRLSGAPIRDAAGAITGAVVIGVNVDRERVAEEALRASESRHQQLFDSPAIGIAQAKINGTITSANDTFLRMLGYTRADLRAGMLDWRALTPPEHLDGNDRRTDELLTTGVLHLSEKAYWHRNGTSVPVVIGGTMVAGSQTELVTFILDITDRKKIEAERESLLRSLARSREFERQLIGIVSHDLKNPLSTILLGTELLVRAQPLGERGCQNVMRIRAAAERANRMIKDLLDFTRARLGAGIPIERRSVGLEPLFHTLIEDVRASHPDRAIVFQTNGECAGSFDADRLAQVLTNLTENALKYSPDGSKVRVMLSGEPDEVILVVHNEGTPIPPELLERVFEPLQRGEAAFDPSGRSVGLGLYIVKHLVEAHGGHIDVRSSDAEGTQFLVRLPR